MNTSTRQLQGVVYLLHLESKLGHAQHYIGWAANLPGRLWHHRHGRGSRLLAEANRRGIRYCVAREWDGDRHFERHLKNMKMAPRLCPVCKRAHDFETAFKQYP